MRKVSYSENGRTFMDILTERLRYGKFLGFIKKEKLSLVDKNICDLGCGYNCGFLVYMSKKEPTLGLYGVDITVNPILQKQIGFSYANLESDSIAFKNEQFDIITSLAVIEHLSDPHKYLQEIKRMLKKGGVLVLTTPSLFAKPVLEFFAKVGISTKEEIYDHKIYYTKTTLANLIKKYLPNCKIKYFQCGMNIFLVAKK